jgi:ankyrin repeat protein
MENNNEENSNKFISACKNGDIDQIKLLLNEKQVEINAPNENENPLLLACSIGNKEIVELIIKHGSKIGKTFENGKNALTVAYENGHRHSFEILISHGANFNCQHGFQLLMENCKKEEMGDLEFLLKHGAPTDGDDPDDMTPLMIACENGFIEKVRLLLNQSLNGINQVNKDGLSALYLAFLNNHQEVARLLIEKGADLNCVDDEDKSGLMVACRNNHLTVVESFLNNGAYECVRTERGHTCLYEAYNYGSFETVRYLIQKYPSMASDTLFLETVVLEND